MPLTIISVNISLATYTSSDVNLDKAILHDVNSTKRLYNISLEFKSFINEANSKKDSLAYCLKYLSE
jgi:hypothetical protein